jgi:hypothetical protein
MNEQERRKKYAKESEREEDIVQFGGNAGPLTLKSLREGIAVFGACGAGKAAPMTARLPDQAIDDGCGGEKLLDKAPDAYWGHIPVYIKYQKFMPEHWEWHYQQVQEALTRQPNVAMIPPEGFYIDAVRAVSSTKDGRIGLTVGLSLNESIEGIIYPKSPVQMFVCSVHPPHLEGDDIYGHKFRQYQALGTTENPFPALFDELERKLPDAWTEYLKWRRRQPRKPVPDWLVQLRKNRR